MRMSMCTFHTISPVATKHILEFCAGVAEKKQTKGKKEKEREKKRRKKNQTTQKIYRSHCH